ncbi:hypothetical protein CAUPRSCDRAFT_12120 [Caulochytrium protostelioides]|uniref:Protein kinase domain-containing protein n=1 Tax=Caulochytrium protostelioides TaxID=1555241 RepID=A0A4V1IT86_9FUNG|nr:hypothetical protein CAUPRSCDRAFT_12120 [Caulochytrium protostelioides]
MGLARRWRNEDGAPRALRKKAGFRGTARYASQAAHDGQDLGRVDDLWSLFYLLVEALTGTLPWKGKEKDVIAKVKRANTVPALVAGLPMAMLGFFMHLNSLDRLARPDYEAVRQCMQEMMGMHPSQYPWSDELRHILPEAAPPLRQPPTPAAPQPLLAGKVCAPRGASRATMFLSAKPPRVGPRLADLAFEPYPASLLRTDSGANYAAAPAAVPPTPHLTASHHTVTIDPVAPLPAPVERSLVALKTAALYPGAVGTGLGPGSRVVDAPTAAAAAKGGRSDSGLVNSIKTSLRRKILPERLSHAAPAPAAPEYAAAPDVAMLARRPSSTENTQILIDDTLGVHDVSQFMHPLVTQASMEMTLSVSMPTASPPPPGPSVEKQYQQQTSALPKTFGSPRSWFRKPRPPVAEPVGPAVTKGAATLRRSAVYRPQLVSSSDEGQAGGKSASSPYDSPKLSSLPASGLRAGDAYVTADGAVALPAEPQNMTPQMA